MVTEGSLERDTRFNQAQKLQSSMTISAFKTCKAWFSLNPSMYNSGFYRILESNIHFSLSVFFLFITTLLIVLFSKNLFFSSPCLRNLPLPFIMKFWPSRGTIGSPVLSYGEQSLFRAYHSAGSISRFSHSFLLSALIPLKVLVLFTFFGMCWGMPFSVSPFGSSPFALFSHLGGIPFCQLESRLLPFSFSYFSVLVPRDASYLCHERSLGLLVLVFFCSVSYFLFLSFSFELS